MYFIDMIQLLLITSILGLIRLAECSPVPLLTPHIIRDQTNARSWIDDQLCVLKMGSTCPIGFTEEKVKLSVQTDVNPRDTSANGERLILLGNAGESSLTRNTYDAVYTLTLVTCCKN